MQLIHTIACFLFALSAGAVVYAYLGFPTVLFLAARVFGRSSKVGSLDASDLPDLSLLIVAHNEEAVIEDCIKNALALQYPPDRLEIVIASDGSTDRTTEIVRTYADRGVRLLADATRRGKAAVLNAAMRELRGRIIILSDANTCIDPDAARSLVKWFVDPRVGAVCGRLVLVDPLSGANADGLYWKYETFLKQQEARLGALLGSNGAIYAISRDFYRAVPDNTIVDDFVIPLWAKLQTGCAIVYDYGAVAREETSPNVKTEFRRRARIGAGGWQAMGLLWPLLDPRRGWIAFTFFSHKFLRWLCPFFLLLMLATNLLLLYSSWGRLLLLSQASFYAAATVGTRVPAGTRLSRILRLTNMFVGMNAALLLGFFRWATTPQTGIWPRTPRSA